MAAVWIVLALNVLIILFHALVFIQVIPYSIVWGGRLNTVEDMQVFELISIGVNLLLIALVLTKAKFIFQSAPTRLITVMLSLYVGIFVLNSIGNLNAVTNLEVLIATPITVLLAVLCIRIVIE